jgi:hypothetical protein
MLYSTASANTDYFKKIFAGLNEILTAKQPNVILKKVEN